jgi:membrane protease YdiL (CAAX protease family)
MSFPATFYVCFIGILLPVLCVRSYYKLKAGAPFPPKKVFRLTTLFMHALMFFLAFATWRSFGLPMFPRAAIGLREIGYGLVVLVVFLAFMLPQWKKKAMSNPQKTYRTMPQTTGELGPWAVISLSAGFVEEITYRGVLFGILYDWLDNWWMATLLCALAFALGHSIQGLKNIVIIFVMSVIFQRLVYYTDTLYVAMVVHAVYDFIAGFTYLYFWNHGAKERMEATQPAAGAV